PGSLARGSHHKVKHTTGGWLGKRIGAHRVRGDGFNPKRSILATGSIAPVDGNGVKYFVNTNITFSTSSSASGAMSEASLTAVHHDVSTRLGGVTASQLNDAFDGYNAMAVHVGSGAPPGPVTTGTAAFTIYNRNGVPTTDCSGRQIDFNPQMASGVRMWRKVYVPTVGSFARWVNFFSNTTSAPLTVTMYTSNNLGSGSNTVITGSSDGSLTAETSDTWVSTFQNWSGNTSSDPRLAHVLQGSGAPVGMSMVSFANG